jgi:ABC-type transport system involved in multi-copper enzyme maturation permease subunit
MSEILASISHSHHIVYGPLPHFNFIFIGVILVICIVLCVKLFNRKDGGDLE